jgi:hypothetical protein
MSQTTKLNLLSMDALDTFKRRIEEERGSLALEENENIPSDRLYELIREVADESTPDTDQGQGVAALLSLALENPGFATGEIPHISLTEWEEMGNECTPIALIREHIYLWLVAELESYCQQDNL